jgi:hypothetical protein
MHIDVRDLRQLQLCACSNSSVSRFMHVRDCNFTCTICLRDPLQLQRAGASCAYACMCKANARARTSSCQNLFVTLAPAGRESNLHVHQYVYLQLIMSSVHACIRVYVYVYGTFEFMYTCAHANVPSFFFVPTHSDLFVCRELAIELSIAHAIDYSRSMPSRGSGSECIDICCAHAGTGGAFSIAIDDMENTVPDLACMHAHCS